MSDSPASAPSPSLRLRFAAWRLLVLIWLLAGAWWVFDGAGSVAGWHTLNGCAVAMTLLLATTPPNAIRLPRERSERFLVTGIGWFGAWSFFGAHAGLLRTAVVLGLMLIAWHLSMRWLRRHDVSAWWAALVLWHPLTLAQLA